MEPFLQKLFKNFEEKEIEFLKEWFCQKLLSKDDNNWAIVVKKSDGREQEEVELLKYDVIYGYMDDPFYK